MNSWENYGSLSLGMTNSMDDQGKRLKILTHQEIEEIYGVPHFTHEQSRQYFSLAPSEYQELKEPGVHSPNMSQLSRYTVVTIPMSMPGARLIPSSTQINGIDCSFETTKSHQDTRRKQDSLNTFVVLRMASWFMFIMLGERPAHDTSSVPHASRLI